MAELTFERILQWKPMPRLMMLAITIMCFNVVGWYTTLDNPTIEQSGFCSVVFGCFSALCCVARQERRQVTWLLLMVIAEVNGELTVQVLSDTRQWLNVMSQAPG